MNNKKIEKHIQEAFSDYMAGSNASKIKQALDRLKRKKDKSNSTSNTTKNNVSNVEDSDIISSFDEIVSEPDQDKVELAYAINFLNQNVKYGNLRRNIVSMLKNRLTAAVSKLSKLDNLESDNLRKKVARETSNKVLDAVESAVKKSLPMSAAQFLTMRENIQKEVVNLCEYESKKHLRECACQEFDNNNSKSKEAIVIRFIKNV